MAGFNLNLRRRYRWIYALKGETVAMRLIFPTVARKKVKTRVGSGMTRVMWQMWMPNCLKVRRAACCSVHLLRFGMGWGLL